MGKGVVLRVCEVVRRSECYAAVVTYGSMCVCSTYTQRISLLSGIVFDAAPADAGEHTMVALRYR